MDKQTTQSLLDGYEEKPNKKQPKCVPYEDYKEQDPGEYTGAMDENGKRTGQGECVYKNGSKYVGEWKDGKRNGQGALTEADGDHYEGTWKDDMKHGGGIQTWASGKKIEAMWEFGRLDGKGKYKVL